MLDLFAIVCRMYECLTFQSIIISKPVGVNGAESGANVSNVSIGITWTDGESLIESYNSNTLTR